jgi:hypothetical protein
MADFTVTLSDGSSFNLYEHEGTVILLTQPACTEAAALPTLPVGEFISGYKDEGFLVVQ